MARFFYSFDFFVLCVCIFPDMISRFVLMIVAMSVYKYASHVRSGKCNRSGVSLSVCLSVNIGRILRTTHQVAAGDAAIVSFGLCVRRPTHLLELCSNSIGSICYGFVA